MAIGGSDRAIAFILTRDRTRSKAFYTQTVGLPHLFDDPFACVLDLNVAKLRITEIPDFVPAAHPALGWEVPDIRATIQSLVSRGVVMTIYDGFGQDDLGVWTSPDGSALVAWFTDPDGNVLSLTQC